MRFEVSRVEVAYEDGLCSILCEVVGCCSADAQWRVDACDNDDLSFAPAIVLISPMPDARNYFSKGILPMTDFRTLNMVNDI